MTAPIAGAERALSKSRTIGAFALTTVLSGGVSVLSIPLIVMFAGAHAWASIALGQAVGSSVGVLAMFGWGITGPAAIAMMPIPKRASAYWDSIVARGLLFLPSVVITIVVTWLIVPTEQLASTVCAVAMAFGGLSGSWFAVGRKRPDRLFTFDTLPRIAGTVLGIGALWLSGSLVIFGLLQLAGSFTAFLLVTLWALPGFRRPDDAGRGVGHALRVLAAQRHGVAVAVAIASFYPAVLAIVAGFAPSYLPLYALNEKVLRFAVMAIQPIFQYFQSTVPAHSGAALGHALRRASSVITALAITCWIGFAVLLPVASSILTGGQVAVPTLVAINLGAYMGASVIITFLSTVALIAVDRVSAIGRGSLASCAVGLVVIFALAASGDGAAISWGFVVTSVLIIGYLVWVLVRALPAKLAELNPVAQDAGGRPSTL